MAGEGEGGRKEKKEVKHEDTIQYAPFLSYNKVCGWGRDN